MKKAFTLFIMFLVGTIANLYAQPENSLLWEISGNGLNKPSYLLGTIHLFCPGDISLYDNVSKALEQSEQLVLEMDMDDPQLIPEMQKFSMNDSMKNISSLLTAEEQEVLNGFFRKHYNTDLASLGIMRPFVLMSMMMIKGLDCQQPGSYEGLLMKKAAELDMEIVGLEKLAEQIAIFDQVPEKEQLQWLVKYARDEEDFRSDISRLLNAYKNEDLKALLDLMVEYPEYEVIEDAILYDRNQQWIDPIENYISERPTFIAVGAAHLASDRGVVELLRKKGYSLTPMKLN